MDKEYYVVVGAAIAAFFAYVTARISVKAQRDIAQLNAEKDIRLQFDRMNEDRNKVELIAERTKLEILHRIISKVDLENSLTMSYMQSSANIKIIELRERYLSNCERLYEAMAIADIYYFGMSNATHEIFGQSNKFWGYQEQLLQIDIKVNPKGWQDTLSHVMDAGNAINKRAAEIKGLIADRAALLTERLAQAQPTLTEA